MGKVNEELHEYSKWESHHQDRLENLIFYYSFFITFTVSYLFETVAGVLKECFFRGKRSQCFYIVFTLFCSNAFIYMGVMAAGKLSTHYDQTISPSIFWKLLIVNWFVDWIPVVLSLYYGRNKLSTRVFRQRGFYVGEGLLQKDFIESKALVKLSNQEYKRQKTAKQVSKMDEEGESGE